jgi:hypothetical protein
MLSTRPTVIIREVLHWSLAAELLERLLTAAVMTSVSCLGCNGLLFPAGFGTPGFCANPTTGVIAGPAGTLFGTVPYGGAAQLGGVFQLSPPSSGPGPWQETFLYSFLGSSATGPVIADVNGVLYGLASGGPAGCGVVYSLTPPATVGGAWTENILYAFLGGTDGCGSEGELTVGPDGTFYGVTEAGGTGCYPFGCGTVFQLTPPTVVGGTWTESVIHIFIGDSRDGSNPASGVVVNTAKGTLDGTVEGGGTTGLGVVYSLKSPAVAGGTWKETILYNFTGGATDGEFPTGVPLADKNGTLYGVTANGGTGNVGTVFSVTP